MQDIDIPSIIMGSIFPNLRFGVVSLLAVVNRRTFLTGLGGPGFLIYNVIKFLPPIVKPLLNKVFSPTQMLNCKEGLLLHTLDIVVPFHVYKAK